MGLLELNNSVLATRFWSAVKTGTSKDMRDNWAVGWSQRYTVGVWVGNASGAPMWDVSGTSGAAPVWAAVMAYLHRSTPSRAPKPPAGLVQQAVQFAAPGSGTPLEAARSEWFLAGTEQPRFAMKTGAADAISARASGPKCMQTGKNVAARITAPAPGTIVALDPDIPPQRQRLSFTAQAPGLRWRIDGKAVGQGASMAWLPWPGRHRVQLVDGAGRVCDEIRIEVRGAGLAAPGRSR